MRSLFRLSDFSLQGGRAKGAFAHDVVMATISFPVALYLRVGDDLDYSKTGFVIQATVVFAVIAAIVFWAMRLYGSVWRYASMEDLVAIVRAITATVLIFLAAMFLISRLEFVPRSTLAINWLVLLVMLGGPRFIYRMFKDRRATEAKERDGARRIPVLLVGAGDAAEMFVRAINRTRQSVYQAVGMVDEKGGRVGRKIHGIEVLGTVDDIPKIVERLGCEGRRPQRIIVTKTTIDSDDIKRLLQICEKLGMGLGRMPRLDDFHNNIDVAPQIRPINIEDLLGRSQAMLDRDGMAALISGRRVLVTGAGGTIGSELCRQIAAFGPSSIALLDSSEYQLYSIDLEIGERVSDLERHMVLADIRDAGRIDRIFSDVKPQLVFHAAALKHVPMVEQHPEEGALTNVVGTRVIADACCEHDVDVMVLISTDKAVNPSSLMGATKRVAESYCQALGLSRDEGSGPRTCFVTVRFGNVLGSTGSVVPLFQRQLAAGGPLTVTHPDMTRYFMTVREAVELVLQASVLGNGDGTNQGKIYVLDMGEPVKIIDLARQIILLAGLQPDKDVKIKITGVRPGEKLFEEILHASEALVATDHPGILLAAPRAVDLKLLRSTFEELSAAATAGRIAETKAIIERLVPEYQPSHAQTPKSAASS